MGVRMSDREESIAITDLLKRGDLDRALPLVLDRLREIAHDRLRALKPGDTLDTHALVHEVYLKLEDETRIDWQSRGHFFAVASQAMRWIIVNYSERRRAKKRGGGAIHRSLERAGPIAVEAIATDMIDLDRALSRLAGVDERQSRVVECRFFGGLSVEETATALGVSAATVKRDWQVARLWLLREMQEGRSSGS